MDAAKISVNWLQHTWEMKPSSEGRHRDAFQGTAARAYQSVTLLHL